MQETLAVAIFINIDGFCIKNDGFCIKNDGFCIKNDDLNANVQGDPSVEHVGMAWTEIRSRTVDLVMPGGDDEEVPITIDEF